MNTRQKHLKYVADAMEITGLTASTLATKAGMATTTLTRFIGNASMQSLSQVTLDKLAAVTGLHVQSAVSKRSRMIPIVGYVGAGSEIYPIDDHAKGGGIGEVECPDWPALDPEKAIALEIKGDSMYPLLAEGDLVFYQNERMGGVPPEWVTKICVLKIKDGPTLVKRIQKGNGIGRYNLESLNPEVETIKNALVEWSVKIEVMLPR